MRTELGALAARASMEMGQLVAISSPTGDRDGAERMVALCADLMPEGTAIERPLCSTAMCAPDLLGMIDGHGSGRLLLLGHLDTVIPHAEHRSATRDGERIYGSGALDMKGGDALALAVARELAADRSRFAQLAILLVCDEEARAAPFHYVERFADYDACLCFEPASRTISGGEAVVVRRKGAVTMRIDAAGRAAHAGAAPHEGRNALLALAHVASTLSELSDPDGDHQTTVVPTILHAGSAGNVVPANGQLVIDIRSWDTTTLLRAVDEVPDAVLDVSIEPHMEAMWPALDSESATTPILAAASRALGAPLIAIDKGGASDANHFALTLPLTFDGLGPRGGGAHTPEEFVLEQSFVERLGVALAIAEAVLDA